MDRLEHPEKKYNPVSVEREIAQYWEENDIFQKSLENKNKEHKFVFLEGPPTANGLPHPGHVLTRTMKDVVLRYKSMQGFYIERKAGWDTHGLPVEIEVEKKLGLKSKQDVEAYGIEKFNEACKKSVFKYEQSWREMTKRVGFWIDMENPYITLKNDYVESVWWSLKEAWKKAYCTTVIKYCRTAQGAALPSRLMKSHRDIEKLGSLR